MILNIKDHRMTCDVYIYIYRRIVINFFVQIVCIVLLGGWVHVKAMAERCAVSEDAAKLITDTKRHGQM